MTYKAATAYFAAAVVTAVGVAWNLKSELGDIERAASAIREDVAVVKVQVSTLTQIPAADLRNGDQAQYVLVQLPSGSSPHDTFVREILAKQGHIDGASKRNK